MDKVTFAEFQQVDLRIGTVKEAEVPQWSHWVIKMKIDLGPEIGEKTCFSGIMKFFKPKDLVGKQFPFVVNLEPKTVGPEKELSEVMMIMAVPSPEATAGEAVPNLFKLPKKVPNGTRVY